MSKLRQKSEFNIDAAEHLLKKSLYAPSVHCSYYSCFQLLKFTIKDFFDVDYETQSINISSTKQNTHQYVVNYVSDGLKKFVPFEESRNFKHAIKDLKQFRIESDYENIEVNSDKGIEALRKAKEIRSYLINNFNL
jgi:uncharacterized protein (UPF0332 family)